MNPPSPIRYLVQSEDGSLYGYHREDLLRCDLASNKENPPRGIFRLAEKSVTIRYDLIDPSELMPRLASRRSYEFEFARPRHPPSRRQDNC